MNLSACDRILIVKPSSLGDIVHTLPAVASIHRAAPQARIDWLVNTEWRPLLEGIPFLQELICFPRRELSGPRGLFRAREWSRRELAHREYDLAVDFQGLLRSALLARKSGARTVAGFRNAREGAHFFYHLKFQVPDWNRTHAVDRYLAMAEALGGVSGFRDFHLPPGEPPEANSLPQSPVVIHPFSRGAGKSLSIEEVRELCLGLAPHPVILVGIPERPLDIAWPANATDLLGKTSLAQLIHLIRNASWTVSIDSGPMHLAAGITDRVISLHTWSNPCMVGPWQPDAWIWRDSQLVQVRNLHPDSFPERRDLRKQWEQQDRLYSPADISAIGAFVRKQLSS